MNKLKLGVNKISNADYHADNTYLSSSNLKLLIKDREKFYKEKILGEREPQKENPAFDEGSLTHAMILEPEVINDEFAFFDGFRKIGKDYEIFKADEANLGKIIISKPQRMRCEKYFRSYTKNPVAGDLVEGGEPEHTVCVMLNDVPIKIRTDYINIDKGYIADVKTSGYPVDVDTFKHTIDTYDYQLSAALYCMAAEAFYGKPFDFYFIAIGKKDNSCEVYKTSDKTMNLGKHMVLKALKIYKECVKTGVWKNPGSEVLEVENRKDYEILEV